MRISPSPRVNLHSGMHSHLMTPRQQSIETLSHEQLCAVAEHVDTPLALQHPQQSLGAPIRPMAEGVRLQKARGPGVLPYLCAPRNHGRVPSEPAGGAAALGPSSG